MTAAWNEMWSSFTPAGTGWQDYNIYTALGVPKGAIAHIVMMHGDYTNPRTLGVRADGSSLNRYIKVHRSVNDDAGQVTCAMYVKVDSSTGLIETYADSTTSVTFFCSGYWTGVDFTEMMSSVTTGATAAWVDWDVGALGVPDGSICSVACCNHQDAGQSEMGVRTNGSALARYHRVHQSKSGSTETTDCESFTISVVSNSSDGIIEYYNNGGSVSKYHLLGYFGSGLWYTETIWQLASGSAADQVWTDVSMASYVPASAIMDCMIANTRSFAYYVGARANGSSLQRKWIAHQPEDTYRSGECLPTAVDASSVYEMIDYDWAYVRNGPYGYYTTSAPPSVAIFSPSANSYSGTSWSNPTYAYSDNTQYATSKTNNANNTYYNYGITGLSGTIQKVEIDALSFVANSSSANKLRIAVSWDGGSTWSSNTDLSVTNTSTPTDKWVDVTSATDWDWDKLNDSNLRVKVTYINSGTARTISLDWIPVRVTYVEQTLTELFCTENISFGDTTGITKSMCISENIGAEDICPVGKTAYIQENISLGDLLKIFKTIRVSEKITFNDLAKIIKNIILTDGLTLGEVIKFVKTVLISEGAIFTDVPKVTKTIKISDGLTLSEILKISKAFKFSEGINFGDASKATKTLKTSDGFTLGDASKTDKTLKTSDGLTLVDSPKATKTMKTYEGFTLGDILLTTHTLKVSEQVNISEVLKTTHTMKVSEGLTLGDVLKTIHTMKISEQINISDVLKLIKALTVTENIQLSDSAVISKVLKTSEQITLTDSTLRTILGSLVEWIISETIGVSDGVKLIKSMISPQSITIADTTQLNKAAKISEALSLIDNTKVTKSIKTSDNLYIQDAIKLVKALLITETISEADALKIVKAIVIDEDILITEATRLVKAIISNESLAVSDLVVFTKTLLLQEDITLSDVANILNFFQQVIRLKAKKQAKMALTGGEDNSSSLAGDKQSKVTLKGVYDGTN